MAPGEALKSLRSTVNRITDKSQLLFFGPGWYMCRAPCSNNSSSPLAVKHTMEEVTNVIHEQPAARVLGAPPAPVSPRTPADTHYG